jgi:hypothetical protein
MVLQALAQASGQDFIRPLHFVQMAQIQSCIKLSGVRASRAAANQISSKYRNE